MTHPKSGDNECAYTRVRGVVLPDGFFGKKVSFSVRIYIDIYVVAVLWHPGDARRIYSHSFVTQKK